MGGMVLVISKLHLHPQQLFSAVPYKNPNKRQGAMQKRCFPLPEAPGCSLICRAALGLPALHRRPLDEGTEMEQGRGTDNHC